MVTASDLVRHFGVWQERAARAPVYIMHRGRPRHVLTSIDVMNALCAPHESSDAGPARPVEALLDFTTDQLLLTDEALRVTAISLPARRLFAGDARPGVSLDRLVAVPIQPLLVDAARRVIASGTPETLDVTIDRYPGRRYDATLAPHGDGLAILLADASLADEMAAIRATRQAFDGALIAATGVATARINLRGYLDSATESLGAMTGLGLDSLTSVRFVSLVDIASRPALGDAIETVIAGRGALGLGAVLLVNRGAPLPVRIGLSAIRLGAGVTGVAALVARDAFQET